MTPPHPDEFSNEMLEFLLKDPKLSEHLKWKPRLKNVFLQSELQFDFIFLPSPLMYRPLSKTRRY